MELTAANVKKIFLDCLFKVGEPTDNHVKGEGCMMRVGFHPERLETYREDVRSMLDQLPLEFMRNGGGGWSFLQFPMRRDGKQWGEHQNCDELICLGNALGLCLFTLDRELWGSLPGGVPYVTIDLTSGENEHATEAPSDGCVHEVGPSEGSAD
ncbi:hypothetical protein DLP05_122 [Stenotrophomonas phage vB_SmaS_DLP_5]|uniref:Uncharacterized protein n=1 Tax=Stenotrophomonas phage vB_SmaS_DLP_5 TaxID=2044561 RepID=A0A2D2W2R2_9CAUD|nr:hypothetical protein FDJ07_gp099 [Stenotrophomonas phage vB_SmaS_DLP_5]ATS92340.1 hypothetical protein DLP05_122 [Stenotrophomonas phage vB_SmaS_DLP_5]